MLPPTCANITDIGRIPGLFDTLPCAEDATDEEEARNQQAAEIVDERSLSSSANGASTAQSDIPKLRPQIDETDPARAPYHRSHSFQPLGVLKHRYPIHCTQKHLSSAFILLCTSLQFERRCRCASSQLFWLAYQCQHMSKQP